MSTPWSQQTIEQRVNALIKHYEKLISNVDHDNTALLHETYKNDRDRFTTVSEWTNFVHQLRALKGE